MATYCGDIWLHVVKTYGYILWRHMATYCGDIWLHVVETYGYCGDIWLHVVETYGYMLWRHMATCCEDILFMFDMGIDRTDPRKRQDECDRDILFST